MLRELISIFIYIYIYIFTLLPGDEGGDAGDVQGVPVEQRAQPGEHREVNIKHDKQVDTTHLTRNTIHVTRDT